MSVLESIVNLKRIEVAALPDHPALADDLAAAVARRGGVRDFAGALRLPGPGHAALIAEVKRASPSAGLIRADFDPVRIAREYEAAGASCISVLTDRKFFQGELEYLARIRSEVGLPLLRKDFIIDERQILESIQWGADAILLIASILDDQTLSRIYRLTSAAGLAVLVEVHDEIEMDRALAIGAELIGVNNRDLRTFKVDLSTTAKLAARLRANSNGARALLVAESGIHTKADVEHLVSSGARAVLVGESLMRHQDIKAKARELLGY